MEKKKFFSAKNVAYLGVLLALVIVLQAVGGTIVIGPVQLNFTLIPIALGAILFGLWGGALLGFACGIVVLIQVIVGTVPFYTVIWNGSPVVTTFTCVLKTTVAGAVAGVLYGVVAKKNKLAATFVAAGLVPVVNTILFIIGCLCMPNTIQSINPEGVNLFVFILVSIVTFNFFIEFAINVVLAPAIHRVVLVVEKQIGKRKKAVALPEESIENKAAEEQPQAKDNQT